MPRLLDLLAMSRQTNIIGLITGQAASGGVMSRDTYHVHGHLYAKELHLVANLLIFHTIVSMTNALDAIVADGRHRDAVSDEVLAALSPYQIEHINRFGKYVLDLSQKPVPLPFALPVRTRTPRLPPTAPL
jgi:hypothetical protein